MRRNSLLFLCLFLSLCGCVNRTNKTTPVFAPFQMRVNSGGLKVLPSEKGIYHGSYPDFGEGAQTDYQQKIQTFEAIVKRPIGFVTYQNDFVDGLTFPAEAVRQILATGKIPLIRMMPRSVRTQFTGEDPIYKMERFLAGDFDAALIQWAHEARKVDAPLMIEFGPEVNGKWYSWNGMWNGWDHKADYGDPNLYDGPERFRDTYRRIINLFRREGADNITWVFHVDTQPIPDEPWNAMANYYPGDDYIDWIGVSVFGAQAPTDYWGPFTETLDAKWNEVVNLSPDRPIAILEWGIIERPGHPDGKAQWIDEALRAILAGRYPRVRAVNYWHEGSWGTGPDHNFRLDSSPLSLNSYNQDIVDSRFLSNVETLDERAKSTSKATAELIFP